MMRMRTATVLPKGALSLVLCLLTLAPISLPAQDPLPNTAPLTAQGDLALRMVDDINAYLLRLNSAYVFAIIDGGFRTSID